MDDLFSRRMKNLGMSNGDIIKNQGDMFVNATFMNGVAGRICKLYDWNSNFLEDVEARFIEISDYSALKEQVEYHLQFRPLYHPEIKYQGLNSFSEPRMGFYIDIPDDNKVYHRWLIVGRNDKKQFVKYNILKCNWTFKWIQDGIIKSCRGVLRSQNTTSTGISADRYIVSVDTQTTFIVPTNNDTQSIDYNQRFLISTNTNRPIAYAVSNMVDVSPVGVLKLTLIDDHFNPLNDNKELMIADYYKSAVAPVEPNIEPKQTNYSVILGSNVLKCGGSPRTYNAKFYTSTGVVILNKTAQWSNDLSSEMIPYFTITSNGNSLSVQCVDNKTLIGKTIVLTCKDENGECISTLTLEVIAL